MPDLTDLRQVRKQVLKQLISDKQYTQAESQVRSWLDEDPECVSYYELLGGALRGQGRQQEIVPLLSEASRRFPNLPLWRCNNYSERRELARARGIPSIFLNTQFKSGSVFLRDALKNGLDMAWQFLFPEGVAAVMVNEWLTQFQGGGVVCQDHRFFTPEFRDALGKMKDIRMVLHLRDPRQSQLSAVHHYERMLADGPFYARQNLLAMMPQGYEFWTFEQRLDLQLGLCPEANNGAMTRMHQNLEGQIHWVERWLEAIERDEIPVPLVVTDYNDLADGNLQFVANLLDALGIPRESFDFNTMGEKPKPGISHYRRGDPNEWRRSFSEAQQERALKMMTPRVLARYGE